MAAAYFTGLEVFIRMARSAIIWEQGKYAVIFFSLWGMFYVGFKKNAVPYVLYLLFLLPAVGLSLSIIDFDDNFKNAILFNLSGPLCLSVASVFCYGRTIKKDDFLKILDYIVYPLITATVYVILYRPTSIELFTYSGSNAATSGGYSGNQVSTVLGLGFFILVTRFFMPYKNVVVHWTMMFFMVLMGYRALLTFSRGGVVAAVLMAFIFIALYFMKGTTLSKRKTMIKLFVISFGVFFLWGYTEVSTGGMITNRYTNKDALGREKEDITTGRGVLIAAELDQFKRSPWLGGGVGSSSDNFEEELGVNAASHNEVTRMLSEHGLFGLLALLTLIFAPMITKLQGRKNIYFLAFLLFWFLTLMHSAMRIAAPAFIYALCLLNIDYSPVKEPAKRRKVLGESNQALGQQPALNNE
ncbi:O-antigen ligase family protein [Winogradskyella sp.]|uniref:O-antigen ligase family protein n=1 Tax=Winogradskyella sp. TaxID=1883156 RepID=UPI003AB46406